MIVGICRKNNLYKGLYKLYAYIMHTTSAADYRRRVWYHVKYKEL